MLEEYPDILTVEEACEALRMGYNAMYDLLTAVSSRGFGMAVYGVFQSWLSRNTYWKAPESK